MSGRVKYLPPSCWVPCMPVDIGNLQACEEAAGKSVSKKVQRSMGILALFPCHLPLLQGLQRELQLVSLRAWCTLPHFFPLGKQE